MMISNLHKRLTLFLQLTLMIGVVLAVMQGRWLTATVIVGIIGVTLLPLVLGRRFAVHIPPEFEVLAVVFAYVSLFLGEVHGYYLRFWWWDVVLHIGSGFLLGILGFLLVYVLNEVESGRTYAAAIRRTVRVHIRRGDGCALGNIRIRDGPAFRPEYAKKRSGRHDVGPDRGYRRRVLYFAARVELFEQCRKQLVPGAMDCGFCPI